MQKIFIGLLVVQSLLYMVTILLQNIKRRPSYLIGTYMLSYVLIIGMLCEGFLKDFLSNSSLLFPFLVQQFFVMSLFLDFSPFEGGVNELKKRKYVLIKLPILGILALVTLIKFNYSHLISPLFLIICIINLLILLKDASENRIIWRSYLIGIFFLISFMALMYFAQMRVILILVLVQLFFYQALNYILVAKYFKKQLEGNA